MIQDHLQTAPRNPNFQVKWNPVFTRFWKQEIMNFLNVDRAFLARAKEIDQSIEEVQDIDDTSPRGLYYNFWSVFRLAALRDLGEEYFMARCNDGSLDEFIEDLEYHIEAASSDRCNLESILHLEKEASVTCKDGLLLDQGVLLIQAECREIAIRAVVWASSVLSLHSLPEEAD